MAWTACADASKTPGAPSAEVANLLSKLLSHATATIKWLQTNKGPRPAPFGTLWSSLSAVDNAEVDLGSTTTAFSTTVVNYIDHACRATLRRYDLPFYLPSRRLQPTAKSAVKYAKRHAKFLGAWTLRLAVVLKCR
eukprot:COSAG01_NODE_348_length_18498_cov_181.563128_13_plen_136_part_00